MTSSPTTNDYYGKITDDKQQRLRVHRRRCRRSSWHSPTNRVVVSGGRSAGRCRCPCGGRARASPPLTPFRQSRVLRQSYRPNRRRVRGGGRDGGSGTVQSCRGVLPPPLSLSLSSSSSSFEG